MSLVINPIDNTEPYYPHDNTVEIHLCDECGLADRLSQALVHFVTALASLLTDQRMSGLPTRARYKHFKTFVNKLVIILRLFQVLPV